MALGMMVTITNPAIREAGVSLSGAILYELAEPLRVYIDVGASSVELVVPEGFTTDLASVPRFLWPIFPASGLYQRAAIVHDWLYQSRTRLSRFAADAIFREIMAQLGVPAWKRLAMYFAVRAFGWPHWVSP